MFAGLIKQLAGRLKNTAKALPFSKPNKRVSVSSFGLGDGDMSNSNHWNNCTKALVCIVFFIIVSIFNSSQLLADVLHSRSSPKHKTISSYALPQDLSGISLEKLVALREEHEAALWLLTPDKKLHAYIEHTLLNTLLAYDDVRLQIADIIIKLIDEYEVNGRYREKLLGYCDTFNNKIKNARNTVHTLDEYKVYSTHFAAAYISLVYTFKENASFYRQYTNDIYNPESTIGRYRKELALSYKEVEQANKEYEAIIVVQKVEESIALLKKEISRRQARLLVQD